MSCFRGLQRALITALGLSLLLLADGLAVVPSNAVMATDDPDQEAAVAEDVSGYTCESGFADIDSKLDMSLHGVAELTRGTLAVGYTRRRDAANFGRRSPATLVNRGDEWSRVYTSSPGEEDGLMAVASREDADTWAVGWTTVEGQTMPLAMRWNGSDWKVDRPKPKGSLTALFTDVTIVGDGSPFAVGYRMTASGKRQPLVIRKDGPRWRTIPVNTGKRESISFTGVSPDRHGGTWVVGHGGSGAEIRPIIYQRESGKWTRLKAPRLKGEAALTDVVATSGRESWAVGYQRYDGVSYPLVLRWDGRKWRKVKPPAFASDDALLTAVTADPAGGVWVVGAAWNDKRKSHEAVAAWWDGQAWNEFAGRAGGTELYDVTGSLHDDGWAVGRSGQSARATRVCTPLQSGIFGGAEPPAVRTPDDRTEPVVVTEPVAVTEPAVALEPLPNPGLTATTVNEPVEEAGSTDEAAAAAQKNDSSKKNKKNKKKRVAKIKTGPLPTARADKDILARNVARDAGIFEETGTYGAVVDDFDGDGVDDLFIGRHGRRARLLLNRDGVFVDHEALELDAIDRHGCTSADIDGSGLPDLYCAVGGKRGSGLKSNELWLDPGGPAPVEVAVDRGLADPTGRGRLPAFLEARKQNDINLVVTNSPTRVDGLPSIGRRFRTNGNGEFKAKARPGFAPRLGSLAMQDADFDNDGREDLLLITGGPQAPEQAGTRLYRNTRTGLVEVTKRMGIKSFDEVDSELVDINNDGKLDLVQLSPTKLRVSILRNGKYRKAYERKLTYGRGIAGGDVNGDARDDLYIVRSNGNRNYHDVMLVNRNGGAKWSSLLIPQVSGGDGEDAYAIDHDGNGLEDFVVLNGHNQRGPTQLIAFYPR